MKSPFPRFIAAGDRWQKRAPKTSAKSFDKKPEKFRLSPALDGVVAQLVEHHNGIVGVAGSIPVGSTI